MVKARAIAPQPAGALTPFVVKQVNAIWFCYLMVVVPLVYFCSSYLLTHYIYGDQLFYTRFYENVQGARLIDVPLQQLANTGSAEPFFGLVIWLAANLGIAKITFISWVNALLALATGLAVKSAGAGIFVATLVLSNYYFLVLCTSAERLKFSYLLLAFLFFVPAKIKPFVFLSAPLFHFQTVVNYAAIFSHNFFQTRLSHFKKGRFQLKAALYLVVALVVGNLLVAKYGTTLASKFEYYSTITTGSLAQLSKVVILFATGALMGIRIPALLAYFFPIIVALFLVGPERVNMIGFAMFFYLVAQQKKLSHPIFVAMLIYFSYKSIGYVSNILAYGTGYPG